MPDAAIKRLNGISILVIEDNLLIALELEVSFNAAGASVTICSTLEEGSKAFSAGRHHFLLTDYFLEGGPSVSLLEEALALNIPCALLTGYPVEELDNAIPDGLRVFSKPFRDIDIIEHIAQTFRPDAVDDDAASLI